MTGPSKQLGKKFPNRKRPAPFTAAHRLKLSQALSGRKLTDSQKQKLSEARMGMKFSEEHRANISKSLIGNDRAVGSVRSPEQRQATSAMNKGKNTGSENYKWKGDEVGYWGVHSWVIRQLGQPSECECCATTESNRYEWANMSGEYRRDISDWARLCSECHHRFDDQSRKAWQTRRLKEKRIES